MIINRFKHILVVIISLCLLVALPVLTHFDLSGADPQQTDATSSASVVLPDSPSGEFRILMKTSLHQDTISDWDSFFHDDEFVVIFEDISCLVSEGDATAQQMAERYQAQLPEHQMEINAINPTLLVSKVEAGYIDVAIFSKEMAEMLELKDDVDGLTLLTVTGGN